MDDLKQFNKAPNQYNTSILKSMIATEALDSETAVEEM